jgi:hypothetical protein
MRVLRDHRYELQGHLPGAVPSDEDDKDTKLRKTIDPREVQELKISLHDRDIQIAELKGSLSWKITAPMRALGSMFMRSRK